MVVTERKTDLVTAGNEAFEPEKLIDCRHM